MKEFKARKRMGALKAPSTQKSPKKSYKVSEYPANPEEIDISLSQNKIPKKSNKRYFEKKVTGTLQLHSKQKRRNESKVVRPVSSDNKAATSNDHSEHTLKLKNVKASVSAMLEFESKILKSKNNVLFGDDRQFIHMIVQCFRVPVMQYKNYRFSLPHPLIDESSEICLFVPNLQKGKSVDHEPTIEHYQDILNKHKITRISQIIPLRQLHVEYDQFEQRRRLVGQFDMFLADGRVTGHVQGLIGQPIYSKGKLPVAIDFRVKDLKEEVDEALTKTLMMMNGNGNKASLKVGHTKQSVTEIAENIMTVAEGLARKYPGGWANVRSLKIHLQDRVPVPVYLSLKSINEVEVPIVTYTRPKKAVPVEGEVSTMPGVEVKVLPDGEVIVKRKKLTKEDKEMGFTESDLEDFDPDEEMDVNSSDDEAMPEDQAKIVPMSSTVEEDDKDDSDASSVAGDEHIVEAAENAYLNQWRKEWNQNVNEKSKKRKEKQVDDEDSPVIKKPKIVKDKTKKKAHKEKRKEREKGSTKSNEMVEDDSSIIKKQKTVKDKTKKKLHKEKSKEKDKKNTKSNVMNQETVNDKTKKKSPKKKSKKNENKHISVVSTLVEENKSTIDTSSKKLKVKDKMKKTKLESSKNKLKFHKNPSSQKKKKKISA